MKNLLVLSLCFLSLSPLLSQEIPSRNTFIRQGFGYYDQNEGKIIYQDMPYDIELYSADFQRDVESLNGQQTIWAKNISSNNITVLILFDRFMGVMSTEPLPYVKSFGPGVKRLLTLKRTSTAQADFNFNMYYTYGFANPEIKEIDYSLPFSGQSNIKVTQTKYVAPQEYGDKEAEFHGVNFAVPEGSEIIASRGGKVVLVEDKYDAGQNENRISVLHLDGTIGNYLGIQKESSKVNVGDEILMGTPLAMAQKNDNNGIQLLFSLSYLKIEPDLNTEMSTWSTTVFMKPTFHTKENTEALTSGNVYSSFLDDDMVTQEMSRKDRKKYLSDKKN